MNLQRNLHLFVSFHPSAHFYCAGIDGQTKTKPIDMEAIAKHDFNATADDELSFRKNQILKVRMHHIIHGPFDSNIVHWRSASRTCF